MSEWISCAERLPDTDDGGVSDSVLICYYRRCEQCYRKDSGDNISVGFYCDMDNILSWNLCEPLDELYLPKNNSALIKVTHWMPLPEPPK